MANPSPGEWPQPAAGGLAQRVRPKVAGPMTSSGARHPEVRATRASKDESAEVPGPSPFEARLWRAPQSDGIRFAIPPYGLRVGNRAGPAVGKTPLDVEMKLMEVVPERYRLHAHRWLILHGRYTCAARRPLCEKCLIADLCKWPGKTVSSPPVAPTR
jgi:hypothetical protein